jgi:UDP-N-acetylenolpyruvoylglucosamine reductase
MHSRYTVQDQRQEATHTLMWLSARVIQESVYGRFGIRLEPEPVVV